MLLGEAGRVASGAMVAFRPLDDGERMPVQADVRFLNIDLLLVGRFDRRPILAALGRTVFVLHEDAEEDGEPCLILELAGPTRDLPRTLGALLKWAAGLPPRARRSWASASRRLFDIGVEGGLQPHESRWRISRQQVSALAKLGAEVALTVYGAEWTRPAGRAATGGRRPRGQKRRPAERT